jgi:protein-S-isoprenylcysteine O-methyltransferase Ste14
MNDISQTNQASTSPAQARGLARWAIKQTVFVLLIATALFLPAGRSDIARWWVYLGLVALIQVLTGITLYRYNPGLLVERSELKAGLKPWDIGLAVLMGYSPALIALAASLETRAAALPASHPGWLILSVLFAMLGTLFTLWAMAANPFFSGIIRIQAERGHTVASTGPYRYLRHPGYAGMLLFTFASPFILGSVRSLFMVALVVAITILRTSLEDQTLQRELTGYSEYAQRVRYRLVPGIW